MMFSLTNTLKTLILIMTERKQQIIKLLKI